VVDSLKVGLVVDDNKTYIQRSLGRENLWCAFTPQMFRFGILQEALTKHFNVADESEAVVGMGYKVRLVMGSRTNFKLTHPNDLSLFGGSFKN